MKAPETPPKTPEEVSKLFKDKGLSPQFCLVPFTNLIVQSDGSVGCCRNLGSDFTIGQLDQTKENSEYSAFWNSEKMQQWRQEFISGNITTCAEQIRHRGCNLWPEYNTEILTRELTPIQKKPASRLGLNLNGQCNLKCQMCTIWEMPSGLFNPDQPFAPFWDEFKSHLPHLQEVEFFSGEPFIQKDTYKLFELIAEVNPTCKVSITTNAQWKLNDTVRRALDRIEIKTLIVSLDSLNPTTYSRIRKGGQLQTALSTLDDLKTYEADRLARGLSPLGLWVNFLIQQDNWMELPAFFEFEKTRQLKVSKTFLKSPLEHSLLDLPPEEKDKVIETYLKILTSDQLKMALRVILPLLDSMSPLSRSSYLLSIQERITS